MTIDRISTSGLLTQTLADVRRNQSRFVDLQFQVATGFKFEALSDYGNDITRIVDLRSQVSSREGYLRSIDIASTTTSAYNELLDRFADIAQDMIKAADPTVVADPNWTADTQVVVENLMLELQNGLNTRIGDRYIFAGARFESEPVRDLRALENYTVNDIGRADALEAADDVPLILYNDAAPLPAAANPQNQQSYMNVGPAPGSAVAAVPADQFIWTRSDVTVDTAQVLSYGITATDQTFQRMVDGLLRIRSATQAGLTTDERVAFVNEAEILAENALSDIRQLQSTNGVVLNEFNSTSERHTAFINILEGSLVDLTQVDPAEAATRLSALSNQIQASYAAIAQREQLSLVNFLR